MLITRTSTLSGITRTMDIPCSQEDYNRWTLEGVPIQYAMPWLTADQREFIKTGITAEEWEELFAEAE